MTLHRIRTFSLGLSLFLFCSLAPSQADVEPLISADFSSDRAIVSTQQVKAPNQPIEMKILKFASLKERLMTPISEPRRGSFGNSHVDIAPKSWPYPMVISPGGKPVLPGSAW